MKWHYHEQILVNKSQITEIFVFSYAIKMFQCSALYETLCVHTVGVSQYQDIQTVMRGQH